MKNDYQTKKTITKNFRKNKKAKILKQKKSKKILEDLGKLL